MTLLKEMGYDQMKGKNVKLIDPGNTYTINTISALAFLVRVW
tara:strand:+ start:179 stop:304 length:126 start_codon:yes stop_codon:yes gene_type:complete